MKIVQTAIVVILSSNCYCAEVGSKDYVEINLDSATYEFSLPSPFGQSAVSAVLLRGNIVVMTVMTEAGKVVIDQTALSALHIAGGPSVSIPYNREHSNGPLESFSLGFETGPEYQVTIADVPGCADPCTDWVRDMVNFVIYQDGKFEIQVVKTGRLLEGRSSTD